MYEYQLYGSQDGNQSPGIWDVSPWSQNSNQVTPKKNKQPAVHVMESKSKSLTSKKLVVRSVHFSNFFLFPAGTPLIQSKLCFSFVCVTKENRTVPELLFYPRKISSVFRSWWTKTPPNGKQPKQQSRPTTKNNTGVLAWRLRQQIITSKSRAADKSQNELAVRNPTNLIPRWYGSTWSNRVFSPIFHGDQQQQQDNKQRGSEID